MKVSKRIALSPLATLLVALPQIAVAEEVRPDAVVVTASAERQLPGEALSVMRTAAADTASLLAGIPGLSLYTSGGVSSLPAIHGMADDRVRVRVDGMEITSACGNHMNPPLSYIDPASVARLGAIVGITPVSAGGDSIAGTIEASSTAPVFARPGEGALTQGSASAFVRSNGQHAGASIGATVASDRLSLTYSGSASRAGDYTDGHNQKVKSTSFATENHALKLGVQGEGNLVSLQLGTQRIPYQDFVNAHMDMIGNQAVFANLRYEGQFGWGDLDARAYWENTRHQMNVRGDKTPGMDMPMNTEGTNGGYVVKATIDLSSRDILRVGSEFAHFGLDDWWPPSPAQATSACNTGNVNTATCSMAPGTLWNINGGRRDRLGTFAEWEAKWNPRWTSLLGLRNDTVWMNTGKVIGYNMNAAASNSAAYKSDADAFNARDHKRKDSNFDLTALARYEPDARSTYEAGYARKTRSPNLYERYLWINRSSMSIRMNGWAGDANGYSGNLDLRPEIAHTLSASAGWHDARRKEWELKIAPYYTYVQDFIDAVRCPVLAGGNGCTAANLAASSGLVNLQFANQDARLYGFDLSGRSSLGSASAAGNFSLSGVLNYVRGKNLDTGGNLYHIMPVNARLALGHEKGNWSSALELQLVARNQDVAAVRDELKTGGYGLINLKTAYRWAKASVDIGIDNLFNKFYSQPLGGVHWIQDKTGNTPVPGMGRSINAALTVKF